MKKKERVVWILQRVVYHKVGEICVNVPDDIETEDVGDWLMNNEGDWYDDIAQEVHECTLHLGDGIRSGNLGAWTDEDEDVETRYEVKEDDKFIYGGHV